MKFFSVGLLLFVALITCVTADGLRLLSLEDGTELEWVMEDQKLEFMRAGKQFNGYSDREQSFLPVVIATTNLPIRTLSISKMQSYLQQLSSFNNHYRSTTGRQASQYILDTVSSIPGSQAQSPVTILGSHMDSINLSNPTNGRAPGADDDGSGSVNLIEVFRALMEGNFKSSTPVEFHWYSGEDAGLLGSQAIATSYKRNGVNVKAMTQLDMTAYFKPGTTKVVALQSDYVDW
ncbi:Zn-dependent exopeptidase [Dendrothele bispora CBS 962.96]|uniref:Peptide hydrolase n=1 Tax=Dendrothele bispora (strain CBS 962.96) TaxID=1314807 RepID=A0A4S8L214_DENBC|nr:Zn-dependent exopeptidase [Dendrothele bispora CBS 962.96]